MKNAYIGTDTIPIRLSVEHYSHVLNYACTHVHVVRNFNAHTLLNTSVHSEWCMHALGYSKRDNKPTHTNTHTHTHTRVMLHLGSTI